MNVRVDPRAIPTYSPVPPWTDGQIVTRNTDGVLFTYSAVNNALTVDPNQAGIAKDTRGYSILNLPTPVNAGDAANKAYVDTHTGTGGGIPEAPSDGTSYGRQSLTWVRVIASTGDVVDGGNF
jgi:hypothetical protein